MLAPPGSWRPLLGEILDLLLHVIGNEGIGRGEGALAPKCPRIHQCGGKTLTFE